MLLTPELKERFRELGPQDTPNPIIVTRFYAEWVNFSWYPISYDEPKDCFFGLVQGLELKVDYFSHIDLTIIRNSYGLKVERDEKWQEIHLDELRMRVNYGIKIPGK